MNTTHRAFAPPSGYVDRQWWNAHETGDDPGELLHGMIGEMKARQTVLIQNTNKLISIYQWGFRAGESSVVDAECPVDSHQFTLNYARNIVETMHAKICKAKIQPMALTSGGGYLARAAARKLSKAIEGEFDENSVDQIKEDVVTDALVTAHGAGACFVYRSRGKRSRIRIEHVPIEDIRFDEAETRYRRPRSLYKMTKVDRYKVLAMYGGSAPDLYGTRADRRAAILRAPKANLPNEGTRGQGHDQIEIYEAWHLPSDEDAELEDQAELDPDEGESSGELPTSDDDDAPGMCGRHVIAIDGATLYDAEWNRDHFPIAMYVPRPRLRSCWGLSAMFDLCAGQREHEAMTLTIQTAHQRMGMSGFLLYDGAGKIATRKIANGMGIAIRVPGPPGSVVPFTPEPIHPSYYQYKDSIPRDMANAKGVSQLATSSQLPAGLQQASGKALQVFEDFESERLLPEHREIERWHVRVAELVLEEARLMVADNENYGVRYHDKWGYEDISWKQVLKSREQCILKVFPASQLSRQPAARFAQLTELLNAKAINTEQFKRLYDLPDLEAETNLDTADTDVVDMNFDRMVVEGRPVVYEPGFIKPELVLLRGGKFYNVCKQQDVPDERLQLLREYIAEAQRYMEEQAAKAAAASPPAMPPPPPGMGPPPGAPPMPPQAPPGIAA